MRDVAGGSSGRSAEGLALSPQCGQPSSLAPASDAELALAVRTAGSAAALHALVARHDAWIRARIAQEARRAHLPYEDVRDLQQEGFFTLLRVVAVFDAQRGGQASPECFRALLRLKLKSRVRDRARALARAESHLDRSAAAALVLYGAPDNGGPSRPGPGLMTTAAGPAAAAEHRETLERLSQAISKLSAADVCLLEGRAAGVSLRALAARLNQPYRHLKERSRQLRAQLAGELLGCAD
jgi:RNA polymerase sigma factor (sigma-70 family)